MKSLLTELEKKISNTLNKNNFTLNLLSAEHSFKYGENGVTTFKFEITKTNTVWASNKCLATISASRIASNTKRPLQISADMKNVVFSEVDNGNSAISTANGVTDILSSILSAEGQEALLDDLVSFTACELQKIKTAKAKLNETHTQLDEKNSTELINKITSQVKELRGDKSIATFRPASIDFNIQRLSGTTVVNHKVVVSCDKQLIINVNNNKFTKNDFAKLLHGAYLSKNVKFNETKPVEKP